MKKEIPVNITEETEEERTTIYKDDFSFKNTEPKKTLDIKTRIILILIWIILVFIITSRPSWVNKLLNAVQTNKIQMEQTAQTLSWLMVKQKELEKELSEKFSLSINK